MSDEEVRKKERAARKAQREAARQRKKERKNKREAMANKMKVCKDRNGKKATVEATEASSSSMSRKRKLPPNPVANIKGSPYNKNIGVFGTSESSRYVHFQGMKLGDGTSASNLVQQSNFFIHCLVLTRTYAIRPHSGLSSSMNDATVFAAKRDWTGRWRGFTQ